MPGFKNVKKDLIEDIDDDFDIDLGDDEDEEEIVNSPPKSTPNKKSIQRPKEEPSKINPAYIALGCVGVVALLAIGFFIATRGPSEPVVAPEPTNVVENLEEVIDPGMPGLTGDVAGVNNSIITDTDNFMYALNGEAIDANYEVQETTTVTDFINYSKFRSVMGQGLEFYWLEATYKGVPYKVQVTYSVYSKLENTGITVVDMEVLTLTDGNQVVTYMNVRKDAKNTLAR